MYSFLTSDYEILNNVSQTIRGNQLKRFLELCFTNAPYFSLKTADWAITTNKEVREALEPYLLRRFLTLKWFGYDYSNTPPHLVDNMEIQVYRTSLEAKEILLAHFADIFLEEENEGELVPTEQNIEDLCFFTSEELLVGTITHENMLFVNPCFKDLVNQLDSFGVWKYLESEPQVFPYITDLKLK